MRAPTHRYTFEEYVLLERDSTQKHEFYDGEIFAMAGGTPSHAALSAAVLRDIGGQLVGRPCRGYTSDLRVRVQPSGLTTYSDASVVCGELVRDPVDRNSAINPVVLVEVTSRGTEAYDRGIKFEHYQRIPGLRAYLLVSHRERLVELFQREDEGKPWLRTEGRVGATLRIDAIDCALSVDALYAGIELDPE